MISSVAETALSNIAGNPNIMPEDFTGEDGLLYCGKCHTRKEREIIWLDGTVKRVPVVCKCRAEAERMKKEQFQKEEEMRSIQRAKISSMMDDTFKTACFENFQIRNGNERHLKIAQNYCREFQKMYERNQGLLKPKFDHKVTSAINIKNEEKGSVNPEMAMVWDEQKQEYVLTYVNNTDQRSIFDTDFQEAMNEPKENELPLLEGEVIDETALPGPVEGEVRIEDFREDDEPEDDGYGYEDID